MKKNEPIIIHGLLHDVINYKAYIEAQANTPVYNENQSQVQKQKVKTIGGNIHQKPFRNLTTHK